MIPCLNSIALCCLQMKKYSETLMYTKKVITPPVLKVLCDSDYSPRVFSVTLLHFSITLKKIHST